MPCLLIGLGQTRLRHLQHQDAAPVRPPAFVEFGKEQIAAKKFAANLEALVIDAAPAAGKMLARRLAFFLKLRCVDDEFDTAGMTGAATLPGSAHVFSNRSVAVSIRSSSSRMKAARFRPGGIGSR